MNFFFQAEDGIRDGHVTGVQTCALPIYLIKDETNQKRARHAVYENERTIEALKKLEENDLEAFGKLMNESHLSLQHDYERSEERRVGKERITRWEKEH